MGIDDGLRNACKPELVSTVTFLESSLMKKTLPSNSELRQLIQMMEGVNQKIKEAKLRVERGFIDTS